MAAVTFTAADIRPLNGAITRRKTAAGAITAGHAVAIDASGTIVGADADAVGTAKVFGIAVADGTGKTSYVSGDVLDIVVFGPVTGYSAMTPNATIFINATTGVPDDAAAARAFQIGFAESATVLFVRPMQAGALA